MIKIKDSGVFVKNGSVAEIEPSKKDEYAKNTMAYQILKEHNHSQSEKDLKIKFDSIVAHDITYVGIVQTVRAAKKDYDEFPIPFVLTNCHNSLCAVGGTTNEDDHIYGLSAAKKYGGVFVPPHMAIIHQYMREAYAKCGGMILGSDSHTRHGALGTLGFGEGGGELVKQLLGYTYDIAMPEVVAVYLTGSPSPGIGPQDVALAIIGEVFKSGLAKNKVLEFIGPGIENLSVEFRISVDVMTTETTCISSIWTTDEKVEEYYNLHGRKDAYKRLAPGETAYYDGMVELDLSKVVPMIALPFHPCNVYTVKEVQENASDLLREIEKEGGAEGLTDLCLKGGGMRVDQGIIGSCAGGLYESVADAANIIETYGRGSLNDAFSLSVYPASQPIYLSLVENGIAAKLLKAGAVLKTAFCGPCFGAGDVPKNNGFSIRHVTRNFPNREGAKPSLGQTSAVALMDAKSVAATCANGGVLTGADELVESGIGSSPAYFFDSSIYQKRVYEGYGKPNPAEELQFAPGIKDWPDFQGLAENLLLCTAAFIEDEVTTTDELIPSGETSTFRSNPHALAEFTLSRRVPSYVARAKEIRGWEESRRNKSPENIAELEKVFKLMKEGGQPISTDNTAIGSLVYAKKPGDGSAREQAASCQRVLGGLANIAREYATKRYRTNLINWGMIPFIKQGEAEFKLGDYIYVPMIRKNIEALAENLPAYVIDTENESIKEISLSLPELSEIEAELLQKGCLINYYKCD